MAFMVDSMNLFKDYSRRQEIILISFKHKITNI